MATIRPGVFAQPKPVEKKASDIEVKKVKVAIQESDYRVAIAKILREESSKMDISEADVIVAGGFGLGGEEAFKLLQELADCFENSTIAASRKAVDAGWITYPYQVGQTGKTVRPKIYIAAGISGALQHRVGMQKSDLIIAINKDPDAPIFSFADHGIVGDAFQVIPEMIKQVKAMDRQKELAGV